MEQEESRRNMSKKKETSLKWKKRKVCGTCNRIIKIIYSFYPYVIFLKACWYCHVLSIFPPYKLPNNLCSKPLKNRSSSRKFLEIRLNISLLKGCIRYNPFNVVTLDNTTYNQFGTKEISAKIKISIVIPCSL